MIFSFVYRKGGWGGVSLNEIGERCIENMNDMNENEAW